LSNRNFKDSVAVVTGAASGIGLACARLLVARGARVAMVDIDARNGIPLAAQIGALFLETDVSSEESVAASIREVVDRFGRLDILVNCAAIQIMGTSLETSSESWERLLLPGPRTHRVAHRGFRIITPILAVELQEHRSIRNRHGCLKNHDVKCLPHLINFGDDLLVWQ
jgi:NAD(P)-dependent dehydrogenase (short-subunit alcohol dehydrogenase family)